MYVFVKFLKKPFSAVLSFLFSQFTRIRILEIAQSNEVHRQQTVMSPLAIRLYPFVTGGFLMTLWSIKNQEYLY